MTRLGLAGLGAVATLIMTMPVQAQTDFTPLGFDELEGWSEDDHAAALTTFRETCADITSQAWSGVCDLSHTISDHDARDFFEAQFVPVLIDDGTAGLFTGYFEPELHGALTPTAQFRYPLYRLPPEAEATQPWLDRRSLQTSGVLENRDLEIAWVDDPFALFFLQIQGSGRIKLPDGTFLRVGYAGKNGHPYRSIGAELVRRGVFSAQEIDAGLIRDWLEAHPVQGRELLFHNESYVFFRTINDVPPGKGPLGAMNRSVTPLRSLAVDPGFVPLGAPVWIEKQGTDPLRRLMVAQDTGSAIKGAQRADIFFGTGAEAGRIAGRLKDPGRMITLLPKNDPRLASAEDV